MHRETDRYMCNFYIKEMKINGKRRKKRHICFLTRKERCTICGCSFALREKEKEGGMLMACAGMPGPALKLVDKVSSTRPKILGEIIQLVK